MKKIFIIISFFFSVSYAQIEKNIVFYRGDSTRIEFRANGNITNKGIVFVVKLTKSFSSPRLIQKSNLIAGGSASEITAVFSAPQTKVTVILGPEDTQDLTGATPAGYNHQPTVGHTIDHNMTSTDGGYVLWGSGSRISLASWHTNYCTNYITATPSVNYNSGTDVLWNLTGSYYGSSGTANVVGAGIDLSVYFTEDYYRNTRSAWDIGATEYIP